MYVHKLEKDFGCPLEAALEAVSGKWKTRIVGTLYRKGTVRFGDMKKELGGISDAVLSSVLRELQGYGVVDRIAYNEVPLRVEYSLTENGMKLVPIFRSLCLWWQDSQKEEIICKNTHCDGCLDQQHKEQKEELYTDKNYPHFQCEEH